MNKLKILVIGILLGIPLGVPIGIYAYTTLPPLLRELSVKADLLWRAEVIKVADGDTLEVNTWLGHKRTIRLVGVNTPETVDPRRPEQCYGREASNESKRLLNGTTVRLNLDEATGTFDKYNRVLAYVTLESGKMLNLALIEGGFGYEYTYDKRYLHQEEFRKAEKEAKSNKRGLWGVCPTKDPKG